jgi:hypothetical protein
MAGSSADWPRGRSLDALAGGGGHPASAIGKVVPGGFIPDEDKGYLFVAVELPEGASLQRTDEVLKQVETIVGSTEGVRSAVGIAGMNILNSLNFPNAALIFVGLQPWEERKAPELHSSALTREWNKRFQAIPEARVFAFGPPPLPGYGNVSGFTMELQDRTGGTMDQLASYVQQLTSAVANRPEIGRIDDIHPATPQVKVELDREKARTLGVPVDSVFATLQTYLSGLYVNDFVRFGRVFKVFLQAEAQFTSEPDDILHFYVRNNDGQMVPLSTLVTVTKMSGPNLVTRFNLYNAAEIMGAPAPGYSSGQAIQAMEEVMATMPSDVGYEWAGLTLQEKKSEGQAAVIFGMAVLFVFLPLGAVQLGAALFGAPVHTDGRPRHADRHVGAALRPQRVRTDRPGHVDRIGRQERHPDRRVRQDAARGGQGDPRRGGRGFQAAPPADPDDIVCIHPRLRAVDAGHGVRSSVAEHDGHRCRVWHDDRHGDRSLHHSGPVFVQRFSEMGKRQARGSGHGRRGQGRSALMKPRDDMRRAARLGVLVAFLTGCAVGPDYERPAVDAPAQYRTAESEQAAFDPTRNLAALGWWEVFDDPQLRLYLAEALANNWDIKIAAARVLQAAAASGVVRSQFFPSVALGGDVALTRTSEVGPGAVPGGDNEFTVKNAFVSMSTYEIDLWGGSAGRASRHGRSSWRRKQPGKPCGRRSSPRWRWPT